MNRSKNIRILEIMFLSNLRVINYNYNIAYL